MFSKYCSGKFHRIVNVYAPMSMLIAILTIHRRYIYTGRMSYDLCKNAGWINLLDGASKFELVDLLIAIESYLIDKQNEWIQQNILTVHKYASTVSLNKLL